MTTICSDRFICAGFHGIVMLSISFHEVTFGNCFANNFCSYYKHYDEVAHF